MHIQCFYRNAHAKTQHLRQRHYVSLDNWSDATYAPIAANVLKYKKWYTFETRWEISFMLNILAKLSRTYRDLSLEFKVLVEFKEMVAFL